MDNKIRITKKRRLIILTIVLLVIIIVLLIWQTKERELKEPVFLMENSVWLIDGVDENPDDSSSWLIKVPITYKDNINSDRYIDKVVFGENNEFFWEIDGLSFGQVPLFYRGSKCFYGKEIFWGRFAVRKEVVYCSIPADFDKSKLRDVVISEIRVLLWDMEKQENLEMIVPVGECRFTFDESEAFNGIKMEFLENYNGNREALMKDNFN